MNSFWHIGKLSSDQKIPSFPLSHMNTRTDVFAFKHTHACTQKHTHTQTKRENPAKKVLPDYIVKAHVTFIKKKTLTINFKHSDISLGSFLLNLWLQWNVPVNKVTENRPRYPQQHLHQEPFSCLLSLLRLILQYWHSNADSNSEFKMKDEISLRSLNIEMLPQ